MWHRAKKVTLSAGQIEVKIDFPLPIIACNLMFEYTDFYENLQVEYFMLMCVVNRHHSAAVIIPYCAIFPV